MEPNDKLILLDAYALIYRAYYAFIKNPRINSKGFNTSAILGFVNTLEEVLKNQAPTHIGIAFDPAGPTFRHEIYEKYKAQREETPEAIRLSIPIIKEIISAYNIPILEVAGYEADDVIGTLATKASLKSIETYMMTPDKDYGQLVNDNVFIYKPKYGDKEFEIMGIEAVKAKFNIESPTQVIDILGLMGDASDNIPGCPGVGEKTAQKLISEFGSIENLLENTEKLKGAVKTKIEANKELIVFSKFLATIKTDVPIELDMDSLKRQEPDENKLRTIFEEMEFRTLIERVLKNDKTKNDSKKEILSLPFEENKSPIQGNLFEEFTGTTSNSEFKTNLMRLDISIQCYQLADNQHERGQLIQKLVTSKIITIDTETTGTDPIEAEIVGMSFSIKENEAYYVPVPAEKSEALKILNEFKYIFESEEIIKIGQNIKYDMLILKKYGINVKGKIFDTMVAHYVLQPELRHGMDYLAEIYLNYQTIHIDELIGPKGKSQKSMRELPPEDVYLYACEDADITLKLKNILEKKLKENDAEKLFYEIEMPLIPVLVEIESNGVRLDTNALKQSSLQFTEQLIAIEKEIYELAEGIEFNIASPKQVGEILFDKLKIIPKAKKTKTGQYVTSEDVLESLRHKHQIVEKILEYRGLKKLLNTYIDALPLLINPQTGKVHTSFNQTITATGRLSSSNPNLQNIPIRDENGKEIRKAFIPDDGCLFFSADYSQIELRIMAHLSEDKNMIDAFLSGHDIHAATAAKIYKVDINEVDGNMRRKAKTANFGIIYGISVFGLAERLSIDRKEAKELIDGYFETYPQVKIYMERSIESAREKGYVETIFNRKRFLPDINSRNAVVRGYAERNAINAPIQGSAADIIKVAMARIYNRFEKEKISAKMILQVHDELNFSVPREEKEIVQQIVIEEMENAYKMHVPLKADCGWGNNWLEAH